MAKNIQQQNEILMSLSNHQTEMINNDATRTIDFREQFDLFPKIESRPAQQDDLNQQYSNQLILMNKQSVLTSMIEKNIKDEINMQNQQQECINSKQIKSRATQIDDLNQKYTMYELFQINNKSDLSSIILKQFLDKLYMQNQQQEFIDTKQIQSCVKQINEPNQQYSNQSILNNEQSGLTSNIENNIMDEIDMQNGFNKNFSKKHFPQMQQTLQPIKHIYDSKQLLSNNLPETVIRQDSSKNQQKRKIQSDKMDFSHLLSEEASELLNKYRIKDILSLTFDKLQFVYDIDQAKQKFNFEDIAQLCQIFDSVNSRFDYLEMYLQDGRKDLAWTQDEDQILFQNMDCLGIENLIKNKDRQQIEERKKYLQEQ